ncbi:MAG: adenylate kinase [Proteobacteria bacterium]|nr:adenylate kinase [Pseudomonadota bacterium]
MSDQSNIIGTRIHIIGNSASGKSTFGATLARQTNLDLVELDALNWLPDWVGLNATDPAELERRFAEATLGNRWVAAGSYREFAERTFWDRVQTVIFLDLPLPQLLWRVIRRSWKRWRSHELLWGTNYENFWQQLAVWKKEDSLVWWIINAQRGKRDAYVRDQGDPRWAHIRFIRLTSSREINAFLDQLH